MGYIPKMFEDELKELALMIAERKGYLSSVKPTELAEGDCHEEVSEGKAQEVKGEEAEKEGRNHGEL